MTASISAFPGAIPAAGALGGYCPYAGNELYSGDRGTWRTHPASDAPRVSAAAGLRGVAIDRILAIQSDAQAYKQAGNSVTAHVIEAIGRRIREVDAELKAGAAA